MDLSDRYSINIPSTHNTNLRRRLGKKIDSKTKPYGALGFLEEVAIKVGLIFKDLSPKLRKPVIHVYASDHGFVVPGRPASSETHPYVLNFLNEGAAINTFAQNADLNVKLIDVGVNHSFEGTMTYWLHHGTKVKIRKIGMGTRNFLEYPAMTTGDMEKALKTGQQLALEERRKGCNTLGLGELAMGNLSSAVAITSAMLRLDAEELLEPSEENVEWCKVLNKAVRLHPTTHDPYTILTLYGGYEIAAMTGAILQAAKSGMLILIDGYVSTVALALAHSIAPEVVDYSLVCQKTHGKAHQLLLDRLLLKPLLDLDLSMGEGCGVALAVPLVQNALSALRDMSSSSDNADLN